MNGTFPRRRMASPGRPVLPPLLLGLAALVLAGCSDAARPLGAPDGDAPSTAANTSGPLAVVSVVGLDPLLGASSNYSNAFDINDLGLVVGESVTPNSQIHAVVWDPSVSQFPQDLGIPPGGFSSLANAINASGTVVGRVQGADIEFHAARWVREGGAWIIQDLGVLPGGDYSEAFDVNDDGAIVGVSIVGGVNHGFLWQNGVMLDLGPAGLTSANAININRQVVGRNADGHAALWTLAAGAIDLGTLGGSMSVASDINESGEVTGWAETGAAVSRAFLWTKKKGMIDLGTLGGVTSRSVGMNDAGQVVGTSGTADGQARAFLWAKGKMLDLGVLPGYEGGYSDAVAINNMGQVVGRSFVGTSLNSRATLWTVK